MSDSQNTKLHPVHLSAQGSTEESEAAYTKRLAEITVLPRRQ